jgi:hypothetical protein
LYQLEVKLALVRLSFPPTFGWRVHIDVDSMERAQGGLHRLHKPDKAARAAAAAAELEKIGARLMCHPVFGRIDIVAEHDEYGLRLVEVEGDSSRQTEQALYSVPDTPQWLRQLRKLPPAILRRLTLDLYIVAENHVTSVWAGESFPNWARG